MLSALPPVLNFTACPRLCLLVLTLPPVLGFHACSRLCSLSTALSPVLNFLACPRLWRLLPALLVFATWYQQMYQLLYLTPATPRTPSSLAWVQCTQAGLRPNSTRRLAVGPPALGHHNPTVCTVQLYLPLAATIGPAGR